MPRTPTGRTSTTSRRRIAGASAIPAIRIAPRRPTTPVPPYVRDTRWATPTAPRNDVYVVDIADRHPAAVSADEDPLLLTA
ncbi:MAG TPA: hypothetical protein VF253_04915 [Candidatus Limnocylindrales bacterium]